MTSLSNPFDVLTGLGTPVAKNGAMFQNPIGMVDRITSNFGYRTPPSTGGGRRGSSDHKGIDLAEKGQAGYAVEAAGAGRVTFAGSKGGYGLTIEVTHPNGYKTQYSHLSSLNVKKGDEIAAGTPIGKAGNSGNSSGPHLHFEVRDPTGKAVNPKSVTDLANRSLSVTPTPRPTDDIGALMAFDLPSQPVASPAAYADLDASRFGPSTPSMRSSPIGMVSSPVSPIGAYARAEAPTGFSPPRPERFGYNVADIDPARFGPVDISPAASVASFSQPSAERFGYAPEAKSGSLGGLGGMAAKAAIDPDRFGPAQMTSTPTTGRLSSTVNASNSTPMAAAQTQALSSPLSQAFAEAGIPTSRTSTVSVAPSTMGLLPSTSMAPAGPFSSFTAMPTDFNAMTDMKNTMKARPLSMPTMPTIPSVVPPAVKTPTVQPMVTPVAKQPVSPQTTASVRPSQPPMATAADVYAGRATTGVASNGATVSRDPVTGNISVTNQFGATTVTDPSGRQMGNLSGIGKGIGNAFDKAMDHVTPGMIGSVVGGAIAGMPGAIVGGLVGNKMGGQQSGQKSGGLGGLGGFLAGIFGGGSSSSSSGGKGGGSSGSGSRGGGGSSGGRASPGADRSQAGNN